MLVKYARKWGECQTLRSEHYGENDYVTEYLINVSSQT